MTVGRDDLVGPMWLRSTGHQGLLDRFYRLKVVVRRGKKTKLWLYNRLFLIQLRLNHNFSQKMTIILGLLK